VNFPDVSVLLFQLYNIIYPLPHHRATVQLLPIFAMI